MKWLDRALFLSPYHIALCTSEKAFRKEVKRLGVPKAKRPDFIPPNGHAALHCFEKTSAHELAAIVCMRRDKNRSTADNYALLVHEAVHIWQHVREFVGEKNPGSEFEAYAVQFISHNLFEAFADA